jgi:2-keto-4-pentenoate hydratase
MTRQLASRRDRITAGERPLGRKMGFGAPASMQMLGMPAPLIGYLMKGALPESGVTVDLKGWVQPVAEPEIAVRLARDIASGATPEAARAAIASREPAIEMADLDPPPTKDSMETIERDKAGFVYRLDPIGDLSVRFTRG